MSTKVVCDRCDNECQDFETYRLELKKKMYTGQDAINTDREIDLCGACAHQVRVLLSNPKNNVKTMSVNIIVNGKKVISLVEVMTYNQVVDAAHEYDHTPQDMTVSYISKSNSYSTPGTLLPGQTVTIEEGMTFNVVRTNKA